MALDQPLVDETELLTQAHIEFSARTTGTSDRTAKLLRRMGKLEVVTGTFQQPNATVGESTARVESWLPERSKILPQTVRDDSRTMLVASFQKSLMTNFVLMTAVIVPAAHGATVETRLVSLEGLVKQHAARKMTKALSEFLA